MEIINRVRITIGAIPYTITTTEPEEYVQQLAAEINQSLSALMEKNNSLSFTDGLVLCLLDSVDERHKSERNADHIRDQLSGYLKDVEEAAKARIEVEELKNEVSRLRRELNLSRRADNRTDKKQGG